MTIAAPSPGLQPDDYDRIETALMETAQGRLFLAEYARRIRSGESTRMLAAIDRLEARLDAQQAPALTEGRALANRLVELSWSLRESGVEDFVCDKIDALARELQSASGAGQAAQPAPPQSAGARTAPSSVPEVGAAHIGFAPVTLAPPAIDRRFDALSWLDRLSLVDRVALFA